MFPKIPRQVLLLLLLYAKNNEEVVGRSKLQKMLFLIQKEEFKREPLSGVVERYNFHPHFFGPFSDEVTDDIEFLRSLGLIEVKTLRGVEVFYLTEKGLKKMCDLIEEGKIPYFMLDATERVKKKWNRKPTEELTKYVYKHYPEYTTRSRIRI